MKIRSIAKKILFYAAAVLVLATVSGAAYQSWRSAEDRDRYPAPGRLVDVDGLQIHIDCRGQGEPVVLMEAGLMSGSSGWALVHEAAARFTRVCAYDRPGMDWSEPIDRPASTREVAARLHRLIEVTETKGPYILLGMSAGGVYVREYFEAYPDEVLGMILVDSSHEQQGDRFDEVDGDNPMERILTLCSWIQPLGVVRLLGSMEMLADLYGIPDSSRSVFLANANQSRTCASMLLELQGFIPETLDVEPPRRLGDLPLIVLSQGKQPSDNEAFGVSLEQARAHRVVWNQLQLELTALSSHGERRIAHSSGHVIQLEEPQLVIDAISDMVDRVRD